MTDGLIFFFSGTNFSNEVLVYLSIVIGVGIAFLLYWRNKYTVQTSPIRSKSWYHKRCRVLANRHGLSQEEKTILFHLGQKERETRNSRLRF